MWKVCIKERKKEIIGKGFHNLAAKDVTEAMRRAWMQIFAIFSKTNIKYSDHYALNWVCITMEWSILDLVFGPWMVCVSMFGWKMWKAHLLQGKLELGPPAYMY